MDAASIEQMNKVRKSLGLPLLNVPGASSDTNETHTSSGPTFKKSTSKDDDDDDDSSGSDDDEEPASTLETREAAGYENFRQLQEEEKKRLERERRKKAIQRARDLAARNDKLEGKGLGDLDEQQGELDAKSWLKGQKKRQKEIEKDRAKRLQEELIERERLAAIQYSSKDLAGVRVAHEIGDFDDGVGEQILTLKDQEIGNGDDDDDDNEEMGDILENADIVSKDKLKEKAELKKKIAYDVHDQEEKALLSQYDDKKRKAFTLDASGGGSSLDESREAKRQAIGDRLKDMVSLDILKPEPISDYQEIKIKKSKRAKKNKRQKEDDEDIFPIPQINGDQMETDQLGVKSQPRRVETNFNDDEDLANALSFTRKAALKKQKKKASDLVKEIRGEDGNAPDPEVENGITVDDTTTFLDNLATRPPEEEERQQQKLHKSIETAASPNEEEPSPDTEMKDAIALGDDETEILNRLRREQSTHTPEVPHTGLDEEQSLNHGVGAALNLLRQRGLVKANEDPTDKNKLYRDRQKFIHEARLRENDAELKARQQRERDRNSGKLAHLSTREREEHARWQNTQREHQTSIAAASAFNKEYKPDVNIKYIDDDGRSMNQKEAFKHLSHKFHGKGSGKGKTEKHLKKVAEEKRREARSVLDASEESRRGYEGAAQHQRKGGEAGVRLQ